MTVVYTFFMEVEFLSNLKLKVEAVITADFSSYRYLKIDFLQFKLLCVCFYCGLLELGSG